MPPHLHKHCSAPCGINENTRVQAPSRTHTYALALALTLTPCWIVDDSSVFCNGSEIYIKVVLGRWAAKYAHAHIPQRKGFKKGEYKRRETEPGFFFFFRRKRRQRKWKVCIGLCHFPELRDALRLPSLHAPFRRSSCPPSFLTPKNKKNKTFWSVNESLKNGSPLVIKH